MNRQSTDTHPVAAARAACGLSREGLAYKAAVSLKTIERIENGEVAMPHRVTQNAIAAVLEVAATELWPVAA